MSRRISILAVAAMAICAWGGTGPASSSANELTAESYPALISGWTPYFYFTLEAGTVECNTEFNISQYESSSTFTVNPTYSSCSAFGFFEATVNATYCEYVFHITESESLSATMDVECYFTESLTISAGTCEAKIGSQEGLGSVSLENEPEEEILIGPEVQKIVYTVTKDGLFCPFNGTGEKEDGSFEYSPWPMALWAPENPIHIG